MAVAGFFIFASMPVFGQTQAASPSPTPIPTATAIASSSPITTPTPNVETFTPAPPDPVDYFFPDLKPGLTTYDNKYFSFKVNLAVLLDYTFLGQDSISRAQVGPQASRFDLRAARFILSGDFKFKRPWTYMIGRDFNEYRQDEDTIFEGLDFNLTIPLWKKARVTIGKQKEPFIYEMVGDAANLPQQERLLSPFFESRNIGVRYQDNWFKDKVSFSVGIYNEWFQKDLSLSKSGTQISGRFTGLPIESEDGRKYLHLGVGFRYNGADDGRLRYKGRPESNVTDNYVDTGNFPAKYATQFSVENLYNYGPFSILGEYVQSFVSSVERENPTFRGMYITGSYVLTGENRPYDKGVGYARRIIPRSRWGAVELVGRFGYVDLDDTQVKGGTLAKWYAGVNWWASRQWKIGMGYGLADLNRFGTTGRTQTLMTRLQWIY